MMKTVRCGSCRGEFTVQEIEGATACPSCGTRSPPMSIADDRQVAVNLHELRILCIWAGFWAAEKCEVQQQKLVAGIVRSLKEKLPGAALTLADDLKKVSERHRVEYHGPEGVQVFEKKPPS